MTDQHENILKWLRQSGYPLELRVGSALRRAGWRVEHERWYTDPETGKPRPLDIHAYIPFESDKDQNTGVSVQLAIECKSSPGKPWIAFTAPRKHWLEMLEFQTVADELSAQVLMQAQINKVSRPRLIAGKVVLAHGLVSAFVGEKTRDSAPRTGGELGASKGGDPTAPYAALRSALAGARALAAEEELQLLNVPDRNYGSVVLPMVVLDGELFEFFLDESDNETLRQVSHVRTTLNFEAYNSVNVLVVTKEHILDVVGPARQMAAFCRRLLPHMMGFRALATDVLQRIKPARQDAAGSS